jgi:hypothetical protein
MKGKKMSNVQLSRDRIFQKQNVFLYGALLLCLGLAACASQPKHSGTSPLLNNAESSTSDEETSAINNATTSGGEQGSETVSTEVLSSTFPIASETEFDPDSDVTDDPEGGSFRLISTATLSNLIHFYETTLPNLGWTLRYTDANYVGGVSQYWQYGDLYVTLQFGYGENLAQIRVVYSRIGKNALASFPALLPIAEKAELTDFNGASWDFFVGQDYSVLNSFYLNASKTWSNCSGYFGGNPDASCGGDDCGGASTLHLPPGAIPMPAPTQDSRVWKTYCWVLPDQNQVELTIAPHGDDSLLFINVTSLNPSTANLPAGIAIYPGATIQSSEPNTVIFNAPDDWKAVKTFYEQSLTTAGWTSSGPLVETEGSVLMNWQKGSQTVLLSIAGMGGNTCMVIITIE